MDIFKDIQINMDIFVKNRIVMMEVSNMINIDNQKIKKKEKAAVINLFIDQLIDCKLESVSKCM